MLTDQFKVGDRVSIHSGYPVPVDPIAKPVYGTVHAIGQSPERSSYVLVYHDERLPKRFGHDGDGTIPYGFAWYYYKDGDLEKFTPFQLNPAIDLDSII